jgi:F-type H+-transporting ATPase subunit b
MPQIAQLSQTYASQIFWILIIFGFVFFAIGRGMVPKVMATVETRDRQIANDLAAAESARKAADAEEDAWRLHHNQQRAEAQAIIAKAKADAARATEGRLHEANATLDARIANADQRIAAARDGALGEIETVASEAASDIVARLAGVAVSPDAARAAVKEALHG